jgi:ELWxxDGT repeat protein
VSDPSLFSSLDPPAQLSAYNGALYFAADGRIDNKGTELWRYDGMTFTRIAHINSGSSSSSPAYLTVFNNSLYFAATNPNADRELWRLTEVPEPAAISWPQSTQSPSFAEITCRRLGFDLLAVSILPA